MKLTATAVKNAKPGRHTDGEGMPLVERNKPLFSVYELGQADQKFLIADEFLFEVRDRSNSWAGSGRLKAFSFQILEN